MLKGHIGLDSLVFPEGTPGTAIDAFARQSLWSAGLDYLHGTGHGVGAALNVHEGPQSISTRYANVVPLQPGMICSNEPGYYEAGSFGIRIENLLIVREKQTAHKFNGRAYYGFEQLTHVPISTTCLEPSLLTAAEVAWLDGYHARVWERVSPLMDPSSEGARWLREVRPGPVADLALYEAILAHPGVPDAEALALGHARRHGLAVIDDAAAEALQPLFWRMIPRDTVGRSVQAAARTRGCSGAEAAAELGVPAELMASQPCAGRRAEPAADDEDEIE